MTTPTAALVIRGDRQTTRAEGTFAPGAWEGTLFVDLDVLGAALAPFGLQVFSDTPSPRRPWFWIGRRNSRGGWTYSAWRIEQYDPRPGLFVTGLLSAIPHLSKQSPHVAIDIYTHQEDSP